MPLPATLLHPTSLLLPAACLFLSTLPRLVLPLLLLARPSGLLPLLDRLGSLLRSSLLPLLLLRRFGSLLRSSLLPLLLLRWFGSLLRSSLLPLLLLRRFGSLLRSSLLPLLLLRWFGSLLRSSLLPPLLLLRWFGSLLRSSLLPLLLLRWFGGLLRFSLLLFVLLVVLRVSGSNGPKSQYQRRHPDDGNGFHVSSLHYCWQVLVSPRLCAVWYRTGTGDQDIHRVISWCSAASASALVACTVPAG